MRGCALVAATAGAAAAFAGFLAVLGGERTAATASANRVRVINLEAAAHHVLDVIYRRALDVVDAQWVNDDLDAVAVEDEIALFHCIVNRHAVVQPGAAA